MKTIINYKKAILWGIVVYVIDSIFSNLLYMNPLVSGIFNQYSGHPSMKPIETFRGLANWLLLTMLFGTFLINTRLLK